VSKDLRCEPKMCIIILGFDNGIDCESMQDYINVPKFGDEILSGKSNGKVSLGTRELTGLLSCW